MKNAIHRKIFFLIAAGAMFAPISHAKAADLPAPAPVETKADPQIDRYALAREVVEASGQMSGLPELIEAMAPQLQNEMRGRMKNWSDEDNKFFLSTIRSEMLARQHELSERVAAMFAQEFSTDDLLKMRDFYASPTGQTMKARMPKLTRRSAEIGREWGVEVAGEAVLKTLKQMKARPAGARS